MDHVNLTDDERELARMVRDFADEVVAPQAYEADRTKTLPMDVVAQMGELARAVELSEEAVADLPAGLIVAYCWGPACNGACKAALGLARLGRPVKEMLGGFEYWKRDGHPVETS